MVRSFLRRDLLKQFVPSIIFAPTLAGFAGRPASAAQVCVDIKKIDSGAASLRTSLNYTETSPEPNATCSRCAFFTVGAQGCGTCQIFNGPASNEGHCDAWGQKS
ncbi:high-potential iron-sulfur protein [Bradyrhizobium iriomotense]|uniref:high-potential iron-sulfur protein n=1 Tax=Bradyrhizobium iriomotense TaxID=441950 RepID=UPI003D66CB13